MKMGAASAINLIIWAFICGSVYSNPDRLITLIGDQPLKVGQNATIKCASMYPISWKPFYEFTGKYLVSYEFDQKHRHSYESFIHLIDVTHYYVGAFYCCYNDSMKNDESEPKSVNVYVDDIEHLLAYSDHTEIFGVEDEREDTSDFNYIIVPCRPTMENIEVKLFKDNELVSKNIATKSNELGFKISKPLKSHSGRYDCVLYNHDWGRYYRKNFYVFVGTEYNAVQDPVNNLKIISETGYFGIQGEPVTLQCSENILKNETFTINWKLPNNNVANKESRCIYSDIIITDHPTISDHQVAVSKITITGVDIDKDTGIYECEKITPSEYRSSDYIFIKILGKGQGLIEFYELKETSDMDGERTWKIKYKGHPKPTFAWHDQYGKEISNNDKYDVSVTNDTIILRIKNLERKDSGIYTLKGRNDLVSTEKNFTLHVAGCPTMTSGSVFVKEGEMAEFVCDCVGYRKAIFTWKFTKCDLTPKWPECNGGFSEIETNYTQEPIRLGKRTKLKLYAEQPGKVQCESDHADKDNLVEKYLEISDIEKPFYIWLLAEHSPIYVGDNVSIVCGSSVYNYSSDLTWYRNNINITDPENLKDKENLDDNVEFSKNATKYSNRIKLAWNGIRIDNNGTYECRVSTIEHESSDTSMSEKTNISITVHEPIVPEILESNLENAIEALVDKTFQMFCKIIGSPDPELNWYKNGELIKNSYKFNVSPENQTLDVRYITDDDEGEYKCVGVNRFGSAEKSANLTIVGTNSNYYPPKSNETTIIITASSVLILILIICTIFFSTRYRREKKLLHDLAKDGLIDLNGDPGKIKRDLALQEQVECLPYDIDYEFPSEKLKLGKRLGCGAFGVVTKGVATGILSDGEETTVAVKGLRGTARVEEIKALITELKIMVHLGHHVNVVNLLGAVTKNIVKNKVMIIVEYCRFGNLLNFLVKHREHFVDQIDPENDSIDPSILTRNQNQGYTYNPRSTQNQGYSYNASSGEVVPSNINSDSGIYSGIDSSNSQKPSTSGRCQSGQGITLPGDDSTRVVTTTDLGKLPFKWLAIESISDQRFSTFSDVWAFGILMWEVFSLGKNPYPGMDADQKLYFKLRDGYRMEKPENATRRIYEIMLHCWNSNPILRPLFGELEDMLKGLLDKKVAEHYIDLNQEYVEMNAKNLMDGKTDYVELMGAPKIHNYVNTEMKACEPDVYVPMQPILKTGKVRKASSDVTSAMLTELKENLNRPMKKNSFQRNANVDGLARSARSLDL